MGELEQLLASLGPLLAGAFGGASAMSGTPTPTGQPQASSGGFMGGPSNWLNVLMQIQQAMGASQYGSSQLDMMKKIQGLQMMAAQRAMAMTPQMLARNAIRDTLPINRQLAYQVGQAEDANLAGRGMSQSPGATAAGQAAALAPYAQQNQQMGLETAMGGAQLQQNALQMPFALQSPDYLQTLNELSTLGQNSAFPGVR
jgi:hypothetical protein